MLVEKKSFYQEKPDAYNNGSANGYYPVPFRLRPNGRADYRFQGLPF